MHGRRTSSTERKRLQGRDRRRRQRQRQRNRNPVTNLIDPEDYFGMYLPRSLTDKINTGLKPDPKAPMPEFANEREWREWFGQQILAGIIKLTVEKKK
jgi:hypothetical protein